MKYLVTGGAGFIGSNLAFALAGERKAKVAVLDNFSSGTLENLSFTKELTSAEGGSAYGGNLRNYELIRKDIRDAPACDEACRDMDFILHQAALRSVPKSMHHPREYNEVNIAGTLNMLEAALKNKAK